MAEIKTSNFYPSLREMEVGDKIHFPIEKARSIRALASEAGIVMQRKFSTLSNREERTITVTRVS